MTELKLDGNAAAGDLEQLFAFEVTTAVGTCANCGAVGAVGGTNVYAHAPGSSSAALPARVSFFASRTTETPATGWR